MLGPSDYVDEKLAGWIAAIFVGAAGAWKVFYGGRRDQRKDRVEVEQSGGYADAFRNMREEIERQAATIERFSIALGERDAAFEIEVGKRRECERVKFESDMKLAADADRIRWLEGEVTRLGGKP